MLITQRVWHTVRPHDAHRGQGMDIIVCRQEHPVCHVELLPEFLVQEWHPGEDGAADDIAGDGKTPQTHVVQIRWISSMKAAIYASSSSITISWGTCPDAFAMNSQQRGPSKLVPPTRLSGSVYQGTFSTASTAHRARISRDLISCPYNKRDRAL